MTAKQKFQKQIEDLRSQAKALEDQRGLSAREAVDAVAKAKVLRQRADQMQTTLNAGMMDSEFASDDIEARSEIERAAAETWLALDKQINPTKYVNQGEVADLLSRSLGGGRSVDPSLQYDLAARLIAGLGDTDANGLKHITANGVRATLATYGGQSYVLFNVASE